MRLRSWVQGCGCRVPRAAHLTMAAPHTCARCGCPVSPLAALTCRPLGLQSYGAHRMYQSIGWGVFSAPAGVMVQRCGLNAAFLASGAIGLVCTVFVWFCMAPREEDSEVSRPTQGFMGLRATPSAPKPLKQLCIALRAGGSWVSCAHHVLPTRHGNTQPMMTRCWPVPPLPAGPGFPQVVGHNLHPIRAHIAG